PINSFNFRSNNFVVKPDGEIVLYLEDLPDTMVAELTKDGKLNPQFGNGGETFFAGSLFGANTVFQPTFSDNNGMAPFNPLGVTPDGTIVLTGQVFDQSFNAV